MTPCHLVPFFASFLFGSVVMQTANIRKNNRRDNLHQAGEKRLQRACAARIQKVFFSRVAVSSALVQRSLLPFPPKTLHNILFFAHPQKPDTHAPCPNPATVATALVHSTQPWRGYMPMEGARRATATAETRSRARSPPQHTTHSPKTRDRMQRAAIRSVSTRPPLRYTRPP